MFVLITGNYFTGTTTILQIVNTIKNCDICGESKILFNHIIPSYKQLKHLYTERKYSSFEEFCKLTKPAFYNSYNMKDTTLKYKKLIHTLFNSNSNKIWGIKEMCADSGVVTDNMDYVQELNNFVDDLHIIIIKSKNVEDKYYEKIINENKNLKILFIDREYWNDKQHKSIKSIFKFLNKESEYDKKKISYILDNKLVFKKF